MVTTSPDEWVPPPRLTLELHACAENVYLVRNLVDQAADSWSLSQEVRHLGRLILTELTTNACRLYPGKVIHTWVATPRYGVGEVGVWDPDNVNLPRIIAADEAAETGRGLFIINELTGGRLGWHPSRERPGKVVWARFGP
ncbi:ATP-binding protein [Actinoallomurus sp. NPDC052274]|uniref:ATP-binding protein n=1 Tax=Actinoallomurus sp. NPDC052274 TaxID=3155420 RepID=UPI003447BDD0